MVLHLSVRSRPMIAYTAGQGSSACGLLFPSRDLIGGNVISLTGKFITSARRAKKRIEYNYYTSPQNKVDATYFLHSTSYLVISIFSQHSLSTVTGISFAILFPVSP